MKSKVGDVFMKDKLRVLMIGPGRYVRGGITTVVNSYFQLGLDKKITLQYLVTMKDGSKVKKLLVAMLSYFQFYIILPKYDLVHIHMAAQASFSRKSYFVKRAKTAGKKIIIHQHAADFDDYFLRQVDDDMRKRIREIFAMADKVIVLSEEWENFYVSNICDKNKVIVIHNGIVVPDYQKYCYDDHNVLFLGKLGKRKGTYDLIRAIPHVLESVPDAMFYLGGDGEAAQCQAEIDRNGLSDHVKLLGWIHTKEKEEYLKKCSTFVLPSCHEGMPMSVLEAMGNGLATISTNVGGIPQIITNGVNGYIVEACNVMAISDALVDILIHTELRKRFGQAGRVTIETKFNAKKNIIKLLRVYCDLIRGEK